MSTKPVIVVAGLGRCGTSMLMQMLAAGGIACVGEAPAYEDARTEASVEAGWFETLAGQAVKILDPHLVGVPAAQWEAMVILLERRHSEQAKSMGKMLRLLEGLPIEKRHVTRIEKSLRIDSATVRSALSGLPQLRLQFEEVLANPMAAATAIENFLAPCFVVDTRRMAAAVRPRMSQCAPGLDMELSLINAVSPA